MRMRMRLSGIISGYSILLPECISRVQGCIVVVTVTVTIFCHFWDCVTWDRVCVTDADGVVCRDRSVRAFSVADSGDTRASRACNSLHCSTKRNEDTFSNDQQKYCSLQKDEFMVEYVR